MTASLVLIVIAGSAAAGFVSGLSGFAFGMVALSFWVWTLDPHLLSPMVVFGSLISQLMSLGAVRRAFSWARVLPFVVGGIIGVPLGVRLLDVIDVALFRGGVGVILIVYCSCTLLLTRMPPFSGGGRPADALVGLVGGVMGGVAGLTGPAPTLWCTIRGWEKEAQRGVFQIFNFAMHVMTFSAYAVHGSLTGPAAQMFAIMFPAILVPTWAGARLYHRISDTVFRRMVLILLLCTGIVLLVSVLR